MGLGSSSLGSSPQRTSTLVILVLVGTLERDQPLVTVSSHIPADESLNENSNFSWQVKTGIVCETTIASSAYQVLISLYQL